MIKRIGVLLLVLAAASAQAQSVLFGKRLVGKGDRAEDVREVAGNPDRVDRIDDDPSTPAMEIWTYRQKEREVTLWLVGGKVVQVEQREPDPTS